MEYRTIAIAVLALIVIILLPNLFSTQTSQTSNATFTDQDVVKIAANYVETNFNNTIVTATQLNGKVNGVWSITVTYQQGTGSNCKVGKCYWQGPAGMFCRVESSQSLGTCQ